MLRNQDGQEDFFQFELKCANDTITLSTFIECIPQQMVALPEKKLALVHQDYYISIWDIERGIEVSNTRTITKNPDLFSLPNGSLLYRKSIDPNQVSLFDPIKRIHQPVDDSILITDTTKVLNQEEFVCWNNHTVSQILIYNSNNLDKPIARFTDPNQHYSACSFSSFGQDKLIVSALCGLINIFQNKKGEYKKLTSFIAENYYFPLIYGIDNTHFVMFNNQSFDPRLSLWQGTPANNFEKINEEKAKGEVYHFLPFPGIARAFLTCDDFKFKSVKEVTLWDAEELTPHFIYFDHDIKFIVPASPYQFAVFFKEKPFIAIYQSDFLLKRYRHYQSELNKLITHDLLTSNNTLDPNSIGVIKDYFMDDSVTFPLKKGAMNFFTSSSYPLLPPKAPEEREKKCQQKLKANCKI